MAPFIYIQITIITQVNSLSNDVQFHFTSENNLFLQKIIHCLPKQGHCRFPKLEECAHFHYERVQLGIKVRLVEDKTDLQSSTASQQDGCLPNANWFIIKVAACQSEPFLIKRSFDNLKLLDEMLHRCVYDRKISCLTNLNELELTNDLQIENIVAGFLNRFSTIATDSLTCGPILTWFQLDNKGRRLPLGDTETMRSINTPAVGAAYGIRR